jgi:teichuronic acid biosynthesis glycosyltransferase TuaG
VSQAPRDKSQSNTGIEKGLFSIVMPAYNAAATIKASIDSVLTQSYTDWELLVANDCSSDATTSIVETLARQDSRIKLINLTENSGVAGARNAALLSAKGQYICFLDSDDQWAANMLSHHVRQFSEGAKVSCSSYQRFSESGVKGIVMTPEVISPWMMYFINPIGNLTGSYDRAALGLELQKKVRHEDYLMWFNLVRRAGGARGSKQPLGFYRVDANSLSGNKLKAASWHWNLLRQEMGVPFLLAIPAFFIYGVWSVATRAGERVSSKLRRTQ